MCREKWLQSMVDELRPLFDSAGYQVPDNVRASCGWPSKSALARKNRRIGECWSDSCSEAKVFELFISPAIADSSEASAILAHELVHAAVGLKCGHRGAFKRAASAVGLEGKMTATHAGADLVAHLTGLIAKLGDYPHGKLTASNSPKKQSTRMCKVECPTCGCVVRMTRKWIDTIGPPTCACGGEMEETV